MNWNEFFAKKSKLCIMQLQTITCSKDHKVTMNCQFSGVFSPLSTWRGTSFGTCTTGTRTSWTALCLRWRSKAPTGSTFHWRSQCANVSSSRSEFFPSTTRRGWQVLLLIFASFPELALLAAYISLAHACSHFLAPSQVVLWCCNTSTTPTWWIATYSSTFHLSTRIFENKIPIHN